MHVIDLLDRGLFALGELLRAPVVLLLWACVLWVLALGGTWLADHVVRLRQRQAFALKNWAESRDPTALPGLLASFHREVSALQRDREFRAHLEECLARYEARARATTDKARILVRVGPSLGLLGTLIPMGGSLAALAQGNLEGMSGGMISAFTSTIIGLSVGTLAFLITTHRQRWVVEDLRELRLLADLLEASP